MAAGKFELRNFINGEYVESSSKERLTVTSPFNGEVVTHDVQVAGEKEIDAAVAAAKAAYKGGWAKMPGANRGALLFKLANLIERDTALISKLDVYGTGTAISMVKDRQMPLSLSALRHFAGWADKIEGQSFETNDGFYKIVRREPFGVVAAIASFNATMIYFCFKVGAALAAGNCIIFKASEKTPLAAIALGALVKEAGFPPGVIQIVSGGRDTGSLLAHHMGIGLISFTGSNPAGKKIQEASAKSNLKKVILELGGKNPSIIFEDADIQNAVYWSSTMILVTQGQICVAATNIYVQASIVDAFTAALKTAYTQFAALQGKDPLKEDTQLGTLIDKLQFDRVLHYVDLAKKGGELVTGGAPVEGGSLALKPTIFRNISKDNAAYREESFGPIVNIVPFETEEEAIELANDTIFGLAANVYTENLDRALRVSSAAEAGLVSINMPVMPTIGLPFGGWKQSGLSLEGGRLGVEEYTRVKTIVVMQKPPKTS